MRKKWSNLVLVVGALWLMFSIFTSPSYFPIQRNGVTFQIKYIPGKHSPNLQRERNSEEIFGRVLAVSGVTGIVFFLLKRKEGRL